MKVSVLWYWQLAKMHELLGIHYKLGIHQEEESTACVSSQWSDYEYINTTASSIPKTQIFYVGNLLWIIKFHEAPRADIQCLKYHFRHAVELTWNLLWSSSLWCGRPDCWLIYHGWRSLTEHFSPMLYVQLALLHLSCKQFIQVLWFLWSILWKCTKMQMNF